MNYLKKKNGLLPDLQLTYWLSNLMGMAVMKILYHGVLLVVHESKMASYDVNGILDQLVLLRTA